MSNLASWPTLFLPRLLQDADDGEQGPEMCQELPALRQLIDMHIHIVLGIRRLQDGPCPELCHHLPAQCDYLELINQLLPELDTFLKGQQAIT